MIHDWLRLLCDLLPNLNQAFVLRGNGKGVMASWPEGATATSALHAAAVKAVRTGETTTTIGSGQQLLALPMKRDNLVFAVLTLEMAATDHQLKAVIPLANWAIAWLEMMGRDRQRESAGLEKVLKLLEQCARQRNVVDGGRILASAIQEGGSSTAVIVAARKNARLEVVAASDAVTIDRNNPLYSALETHLNSVDEDERAVSLSAFQALLNQHTPAQRAEFFRLGSAVEPLAEIVVLADQQQSPSGAQRAVVRLLGRQLEPLFAEWIDRHHDRSWRIRQKLRAALAGQGKFLGPMSVAVLVALSLVHIPYKVTADAQLEGKVQQAIVAPEDGFLLQAFARAGEVFTKGATLARLDDQTIRLEIQRWESEKQEYQRQYNRELSALNPVQMRIAETKVKQADAQLKIHRQQLRRVNIVAPIDGVIIQGDLSRAVGSPVKKGQLLYEMAPEDEFKLVVWVSERDVYLLRPKQRGNLLLAAFPGNPIKCVVRSISTLFDERDNAIVYRVEAELTDKVDLALRPGLSGVAKIETETRSLAWIISRRALAWLRIRLWSI